MMKRYTYLFFLVFTACITGIPVREEKTVSTETTATEKVIDTPKKTNAAKVSKSHTATTPTDTSSIYYMQSLLNNNKQLTPYLKDKLIAIDSSWFTEGIGASLFIKGLYQLNDSVEAVHMEFGSDVGIEEYVLTFKNNHDFLKKIQISESYNNAPDQDEYVYREAEIVQDSLIQITTHTLYGPEKEPIDSITVKYLKITGEGSFIKVTE